MDIISLSVASTIDSILNFPLVLDVVIVLFLLISTSFGFAKGFWRGLWRFIFVIIMLVISWFFIVEPMAKWIMDDMFSLFKITAVVGDANFTSLGDYLKEVIRLGVETGKLSSKYASEAYVNGLILSLCKSVAWLFLVAIIQFVSWIISSLFYVLLIRLIIPKKVRAVKIKLLGALLGLMQGVVIVFAFMSSFATLSPAIGEISENNPAFSWISPYVVSIFKGFNPENSNILRPYVNTIEENFTEKLIGFEVDGNVYNGSLEIKEFFSLTNTFADENPSETARINLDFDTSICE